MDRQPPVRVTYNVFCCVFQWYLKTSASQQFTDGTSKSHMWSPRRVGHTFSQVTACLSHRNKSSMENEIQKDDPRAGWEADICKSSKTVGRHAAPVHSKQSKSMWIMWRFSEKLFVKHSHCRGWKKLNWRPHGAGEQQQIMLPTEHGDHICHVCNTPSARTQVFICACCKGLCPHSEFETSKTAIFH